MNESVETVRQFYRLSEAFCSDLAAYADVLHPEVRFIEYPNAITPRQRERDAVEGMKGMAAGRLMLREQRFEIRNAFGDAGRCVVEASWTGTMAIDAGALKSGQVLRADICAVFELREGKIYRARNYDCYEAFH